jgi:hypothetical protein
MNHQNLGSRHTKKLKNNIRHVNIIDYKVRCLLIASMGVV